MAEISDQEIEKLERQMLEVAHRRLCWLDDRLKGTPRWRLIRRWELGVRLDQVMEIYGYFARKFSDPRYLPGRNER